MQTVSNAFLHAMIATLGGFTLNERADTFKQTGFAVSCHKDREVVSRLDTLTPEKIAQFRADNADLLLTEGFCFGAWLDGSDASVYLDVATVVPDEDTAHALGYLHDQIAIYDLGRASAISTREPAFSLA